MIGWSWFVWLAVLVEPADCPARVRHLYEQGLHIEAARTAEQCWAASQQPILLYYAAMARLRVGQRTEAVLHLRAYLDQNDGDTSRRARAEQRLAEVMAELVRVTLDAPAGEVLLLLRGQSERVVIAWAGGAGELCVEPGEWRVWLADETVEKARSLVAADGAQWRVMPKIVGPPKAETFAVDIAARPWRGVSLEWWPAPAGTPRRTLALGGEGTRLELAKGAWHLGVRAPGREAVVREVAVDGPSKLTFELRRDPVNRARVGLGIGLGLASLGLWTVGALMAAKGQSWYAASNHWKGTFQLHRADGVESYQEWSLIGYDLMMAGVGVLGAAAGVTSVAITDAVAPRRRMPAVELGIGGGMMLGGVALLVPRMFARGRSWDDGYTGGVVAGDVSATALLGAGVGLVSAGLVSALVRRTVERRGARQRKRYAARP